MQPGAWVKGELWLSSVGIALRVAVVVAGSTERPYAGGLGCSWVVEGPSMLPMMIVDERDSSWF